MKFNIQLFASLCVYSILSPHATVSAKPNILVIFADDVGTGDVPGYWNSELGLGGVVDMPNLQSLVDEGTTFTDAHSTPLCAPSRYVFLSGNYQHRGISFTSLWGLNYKYNQFREGQMSIAEVLRNDGYDTAMFGKWHIGGRVPTIDSYKPKKFYASKKNILLSPKHDWTKPLGDGPTDIGFETSYITAGGIQNPPYAFYRNNMLDTDLDDIIEWKKGNYTVQNGYSILKATGEGDKDWDSTDYNMILVKETEAFLDNHKKTRQDDPFFAYVALGAVHVPQSPPLNYRDGTKVYGEYGDRHLDGLFEMDKVVGSLVEALEDRGLLEDTIIVFTSDNGGLGLRYSDSTQFGHYSNGPLRGSKGEVYEGGIRIPMTIRWDKGQIPKGESRSKLVALNDLFSTVCNLADVEVPENQAVDSVNFKDYLYDETKDTRETYGVWKYDDAKLSYEVVRKNEMKLVHHLPNDSYELFNLTADVTESNDLSKGNQNTVHQLMQTLQTFGPCYDSPGKFDVKMKTKVRRKTCEYFKQKPKRRCKKYKEGEVHCRSTCALKNKNYCDRGERVIL